MDNPFSVIGASRNYKGPLRTNRDKNSVSDLFKQVYAKHYGVFEGASFGVEGI
jgi:hypothetical protein